MTQPPTGSVPSSPGLLPGGAAGPGQAPGPLPSVPGQHPRPGTVPAGPEPARRTAWAEGVDRLRAAAITEPGRPRVIGAVLAALVLAFGAVAAWQASDRARAAGDDGRDAFTGLPAGAAALAALGAVAALLGIGRRLSEYR